MAKVHIQNEGEYTMALISLVLMLAGHPEAEEIREHILGITEYIADVAYEEGVASRP